MIKKKYNKTTEKLMKFFCAYTYKVVIFVVSYVKINVPPIFPGTSLS
jgi:hypothetical protein